MHDILLGVGRYDMAKIINQCIKKGYFTLERPNDRLKYFDYSEFDHGNRLTSTISALHVKNGNLILSKPESVNGH